MVRRCNACGAEFSPSDSKIRRRDWKCGPCSYGKRPSTNGPNPSAHSPVEGRFWSKVLKGTDQECWLWNASRIKDGYGKFSVSGVYQQSHRISWQLTNGPIPDGLCVLHRCDNPPCVNPNHLFLGTNLDNVRDMFAKGRNPSRKRIAMEAK